MCGHYAGTVHSHVYNSIGLNYTGHDYLGHYTGTVYSHAHNSVGHNDIGHTYLGHYTGTVRSHVRTHLYARVHTLILAHV